ncbi:MAG: TM1266 family iron-only hydrogenase system putative regulator [Sphaerochaeta sp.]
MRFSVNNGCFSYGDNQILKDVNFCLESGDLLAILGPNGVGKTTLIRNMLGFLNWSSGDSELNGKSIKSYKSHDLWKEISYVPQSRNVEQSSLSCLEYVLLGRASNMNYFSLPSQRDVAKAEEVIEKLGVTRLKDRRANELSGGELQLFLIARALVSNPKLIVLDEPESNLDFKNQLIVLDVLSQLVEEGIAVIFNTHYPTHALQRANKSLMLKRGGETIFGDTHKIIKENNLVSTFGVRTIIGEIETENKIYKNILPLEILKDEDCHCFDADDDSNGNRLAMVSIIVEDSTKVNAINEELHKVSKYIKGRMGLPQIERGIQLITVVMEGPFDEINTLNATLSKYKGICIKTTCSRV